jgi:hypothetical protein
VRVPCLAEFLALVIVPNPRGQRAAVAFRACAERGRDNDDLHRGAIGPYRLVPFVHATLERSIERVGGLGGVLRVTQIGRRVVVDVTVVLTVDVRITSVGVEAGVARDEVLKVRVVVLESRCESVDRLIEGCVCLLVFRRRRYGDEAILEAARSWTESLPRRDVRSARSNPARRRSGNTEDRMTDLASAGEDRHRDRAEYGDYHRPSGRASADQRLLLPLLDRRTAARFSRSSLALRSASSSAATFCSTPSVSAEGEHGG